MSKHPKWRDQWEPFIDLMEERLQQGHQEYGDYSFERPEGELLAELEEELLDVVGWGYVLWTRVRDLHDKLKE